ncbi:hypothetical protein A9Q81_06875 [Gammaproteobacteria bacterium 42_54_T18]|nr:hypothetical protein A9Q81_06875 [Gammaproteobacteria bacterium 42_54_T18]
MRKSLMLFVIPILICLSSFSDAKGEDSENISLKVATIDWCPAICVDSSKPGFIREIVQEVFNDTEVTITFHFMPWVRAVREVERGLFDALLSPVKSEAPTLLYPEFELGQQATCFYVDKDDPWKYQDKNPSFQNRRVIIVKGNSLLHLDQYISEHPEIFIYLTFSNFIERAINMLNFDRVNTFVYTKTETEFQLKNMGMSEDFKNAGCVSTVNLYMAFANTNTKRSNSLIELFDRKMAVIRKTNRIESILAKYGLHDWR